MGRFREHLDICLDQVRIAESTQIWINSRGLYCTVIDTEVEGSVIGNSIFDGSACDGRRHTGCDKLVASLSTVPSNALTCNIMLGIDENIQL